MARNAILSAITEVSFCSVWNEKKRGPPGWGGPNVRKTSQLGAAQYVLHPRAVQKGDELTADAG